MYGALIASLSLIALLLTANETFARSGTASRGGFTSAHSMSHLSVAQSLRHFRRRNTGALWPVAADYYGTGDYYGTSGGEPLVDVAQPNSGDVRYTTTYDIPWDWAHRFPPMVAPSDRPYVPGCPTEVVTVPGHNGKEQTVNVTRCF